MSQKFLRIVLILLAAGHIGFARPQTPVQAGELEHTTAGGVIEENASDPKNVAYAKQLEAIIAQSESGSGNVISGVAGNHTGGGEAGLQPDQGAEGCTRLKDGGNPHQNPRHTQISNTVTCNNHPCSVTYSTSETYGYTWSLSAPTTWISGGFTVMSSTSDSNTYTCNGGPGESICVWSTIGTTAYTVENFFAILASCTQYESTSILFSPNRCWNQPNYYCVTGPCRTNGQYYYDTDNAVAGGPASNC